MPSTSSSVEYRIVALGAGGVGKSCLCIQFIQGHFVQTYDPTVEDSYRKQINLDGTPYMIEVLDTAGQDQYTSMRERYMKSGDGFVLVYSTADPSSLKAAIGIHDHLVKVQGRPDFPCILVGNKADLLQERQVETHEGRALAEAWGCQFCESSALFRKSPPKETSPPHMHHITGAEDVFVRLLRKMLNPSCDPTATPPPPHDSYHQNNNNNNSSMPPLPPPATGNNN
eukprot:PhM_4_TR15460/c0_g1_i1/m.83015